MSSVREVLSKLRKTKKEMASKLHMSSSMISLIESGERKPPKDFSQRVCSVYNLNQEEKMELDLAIASHPLVGYVAFDVDVEKDPSAARLAMLFARKFENLSIAQKSRIWLILNEVEANKNLSQ